MGVQTVSTPTDDFDGDLAPEGVEAVGFALDGKAYLIDLREKNAEALRAALAPFIAKAQEIGPANVGTSKVGVTESTGPRTVEPIRTGGRSAAKAAPTKATRTRSTAGDRNPDAEAIREWAKKQGLSVSDRGRIPAAIVEQYNARDTGGTVTPISAPTKAPAAAKKAPAAKATASPGFSG